jgi:hypothetical protein
MNALLAEPVQKSARLALSAKAMESMLSTQMLALSAEAAQMHVRPVQSKLRENS